MKTYLLLLLSLGSLQGFGQLNGQKKYNALENRKSLPDLPDSVKRMLLQKNNNLATRQNGRNDMPVLKQKLHGVYSGNNGKGSDIYAMQPYNMPCLVPDSTFTSNMPVKRSLIKQTPIELKKEADK